ncbi:MAG: NFACT family protein [Planctomycetes bacterium]|nr:NFACT family protein [Planctomycetota bacterium]
MGMTAAQLARALAEFAPRLAGARLESIAQPAEHALRLGFHAAGDDADLLLSAHPKFARAHLLATRPPALPAPPRFAQYLKAHLLNARVLALEQLPEEAVLRLLFLHRDEAGQETRPVLIAELFGRAPNLLLVGDDGLVRDALRQERGGRRELAPGVAYVPWPKRPAPAGSGAAPAAAADPVIARCAATGESDNDAAAGWFGAAEAAWEVEGLRGELTERLARWEKRLAGALAGLERAAVAAAGAEEDLHRGELVKANLFRIRPGDAAIEVEDFYREELPQVVVPLLPALDGQANAERYFARYRKRKQALAGIERRRADVTRQGAQVAELAEIGRGLDRPRAGRTVREPRAVRRRAGPRRFVSADGMAILVGQNAAENDELTLRIAAGHDLWLHAQHGAGAHVVVRTPRGKTVPLESRLAAATLALHFSKFRGAGRGEVTYTERKHVTKPRRAPTGLVLVSAVKTLNIDIDAKRLERLFGNQPGAEEEEGARG